MFQSCRAMDQSLHILKRLLQVRKSLERDNIHCVYALNKNNHAEF